MTYLIATLSLFVWAATAVAEDTLREISWERRSAGAGTTILPPDDATAFARLKAEHTGPGPATVTLLILKRPPIMSIRYGITGTVRYQGIEGTGFLEMWSIFPGGGRYFSRTVADRGPLRSLSGSSDWRLFVLPFFSQEGAPPPTTLIVNLVLPGPGTVELGPLRLVQYGPAEDPLAMAAQWWSDQAGGWIGAILGSVVGILGGVIGWLGGTGRARRFVLGLTMTLTGLGLVSLVLGLFALTQAQPYAVYYPLLLLGVICTAVGALLLHPLRKRYETLELRRMRAVDAR